MITGTVKIIADDGASSEAAEYKESAHPQARRGSVTSCRFLVFYRGRWRRLYSDSAARGVPHFIRVDGERVAVDGVTP